MAKNGTEKGAKLLLKFKNNKVEDGGLLTDADK